MILFGCWNQGLCNTREPDSNGMSAVMKKLESENPNFIIVLGDNYYPKKEKVHGIKTKIFNEAELNSGFDCLKNLKTKDTPGIHLLMGNHDLQEENGIVTNNNVIQNECIITQTEMDMANDPKIDIKSYGKLLGNDTICLFICSTLYTEKADEIVKCMGIYRPEYVKMGLKNIIKREHEIITTELNRLLKLLPGTLKNLIICGHEPIVSRRYKRPKNVKTVLNEEGIELLNDLYILAGNVNKYYICADVHQYQEGIVTLFTNPISHIINQYVVGVGGTKCDETCISEQEIDPGVYSGIGKPEYINENIKYKMEVCKREFGYLSCKENNGVLTCEFISVEPCDKFEKKKEKKGGKKKRKTRKKNKKKTRKKKTKRRNK